MKVPTWIRLVSISFQNGAPVLEEPARVSFDNSPDYLVLNNQSAEKTDAGKYSLVMRNDLGFDTVQLNVQVVGR